MIEELPFLKEINEQLGTIINRTARKTVHLSGDLFDDLASYILETQIRSSGQALKFNRMKNTMDIIS